MFNNKIKQNFPIQKKCYFQLLEVMIAAFILLLCLAPAIQIFSNLYLSQQRVIQQNQLDHLAKKIHADIVEKLYRKQFSLESALEARDYLVDQPEIKEALDKLNYQAIYRFVDPIPPRKLKKGALFKYLLTIQVVMEPKSGKSFVAFGIGKEEKSHQYKYRIYLETENPPVDSENLPEEEEKTAEEVERNEE